MKRIFVLIVLLITLHGLAQTSAPLISNFRIEPNQPSRLYFDSSEPIFGTNVNGFAISGKVISGVTISSGSTTGHYFTVSASFTFWDNNTIRYEGGSNLKNASGLGVSEFTLTYIKNKLPEPKGNGKTYYVSISGNDNKDGSSESNSWRTISKAASIAKAGDIVFIKAGNYGNDNVESNNNGSTNAPIKFIGYKNIPGDLDNFTYYRFGDGKLDGIRAPLLTGGSRSSGVGWNLSGKSYVIMRNLQIENYRMNIQGFSSPNNLVFDNMVLAGSGEHNVMLTHIGGHHIRFTKTLSYNGMVSAIMLGGDFNAILNCKTYADEPQKNIAMDYHIYLYGSNNIVSNHYGQQMGNLTHAGHGIALKSSGERTQYNLVENCEMNNVTGALEFRHSDVKYNVAKNFRSDGGLGSKKSGGIVFRDGASFNIVENSIVKNTTADYYGSITFLDRSEDGGYGQRVEGNIVRNSVFINPKSTFIMLGETTSSSQRFDVINNKIYNCVFYSGSNLFTRFTAGISSGNEMVNCAILNVKSENENPSPSGFNQTNNNYFVSFPPPAGIGNLSVDPKFESPSSGNFRLKSDSPLIDRGKIINGVKSDFDGKARPSGKSVDIGAFEYHDKTVSTIKADAGKDVTICSGNSVILTAAGGSAYKWSTGEATKSITVSPKTTTTYSVSVTNGRSSNTDDVVVTVNPVPVAEAGANQTIIAGQSVKLTASGGDSYLWSTGANTASITVKPTVTTNYEVTVEKNGCSSKDIVQVKVNNSSQTSIVSADAGKDVTICIGNSTTLTASGGSVYKWSTGATTKSITVSPGTTTTYSVTVSEGTSSGTDDVVVTVKETPVANAGSNKTIESGQSTTLTATGGDSYLWSNGETTASITVNPTVTTTYEVTVTKNGCTSKDSVTVTVNGSTVPPATVTADAGQDQSICNGSSATLTASGGSVYKWSTGATTKSITVSPGTTTTYSVTVSEGTGSGTDDVVVTVKETPVADAGSNKTIESGQSTTLTATGGDTYLWSNGETTASITVNPTVTTTYEVTVTKNGCTSKDSVTVTVNGSTVPPATVTADAGQDQSICNGSSTTLTASGGSVYKWSTGATTKSITVSPGATTTYSVTVSEGTSSGIDDVVVTVKETPVADAGSNKTIESGQSTTLTATGGDTYLWSTGETTQSITVKPDKSTIYSVTVNQNGCSSSDSVQVTVNVPPPADANAGSDLTICKGESITINGDGGATYSWSTGATSQQITVSPTRTTTYTLTASRGGTTSTDEVIVTVINCNLNNGVNNSVSSSTTGNTNPTNPSEQDDVQVLNKADFELTVYPNPTEGKLNVQTTIPIYNFNLVLFNINGNVIYTDEMDAAKDGINKEIDLSGFAKGVYLLQLYNTEESYLKKVILL